MAVATLVVTLLDAKGERSTTRFNLPANTILANVQARAASLMATIDPLVLGRIVGAAVTYEMDTSAHAAKVISSTADVEELGRFIFQTAAGKYTRASIPTWSETFTLPNTSSINLSDGAVDDFVQEILTGTWVDTNSSDIVSVAEAYEAYGKTRRSR